MAVAKVQVAATAMKPVFIYAVFASLWILLSDKAVVWIFSDPAQIAFVSTLKGWLFVAVTSVLLFVLLTAWRESIAAAKNGEMPEHATTKRTGPTRVTLVFLSLALIVPLIGIAFVKIQAPQIEHEAYGNLQAITQLKADQVENWLSERQGESRVLKASAGLNGHVQNYLQAQTDKNEILKYFQILLESHDHHTVILTDGRGQALLAQGGNREISPALRDLLAVAMTTREVQHSNLYRGEGGQVVLDWIVPLVVSDVQVEHAPAAIIMRDLADQFLYPLILTWPTASASAETLLVRKQGEAVIYLNELRHLHGTALKHTADSNSSTLPAVAVNTFIPGTLRGKDYRDVDVLVAHRPIRGTDWHILGKIDRDEIFAPMWQTLYWIGFVAAVAILAIMLAIFLLWRQIQRSQQLALLAQKNQSDRLFATIADNSSDLIFVKDLESHYLLINRETARVLGETADAISDAMELLPAAQADAIRANDLRILEEKIICNFEETVTTVAGERIYLSTKGPMYGEDGQVNGLFSISRDITASKAAVNALKTSEEKFSKAFLASPEAITITSIEDGKYVDVNEIFLKITGFQRDGVIDHTSVELAIWSDMGDRLKFVKELSRNGCLRDFEARYRMKSGEIRTFLVSSERITLQGVECSLNFILDITERKKIEERIQELAFFDQLTGLPNRTLLMDRLKQTMAACSRSGNYAALLLIDLDNFKTLNDTVGHDTGDQLLQQVGQRLMLCVREGDTVARLGGDEFMVALAGLSASKGDAANGIETVAEKILASLDQPYQLGTVSHRSTASIGITLFNGDLVSIDELMKQADLAMYRSKDTGRNAWHFFDPLMESIVKERAALENELRIGIAGNQLLLHYQAQVVDEGRVIGAEVLVRWQHPQRGIVAPAEFIPLAEETGLILPLGQWVLESACRQLALWAIQADKSHLTVAVNISAHQIRQGDFVDQVMTIIKRSGANPKRLKLELTESLLVSNVEDVIAKMTMLKAQGVGFSLDDFGTGYSSLSYLKRLPLDQLKIDQSFVRDVLTDINDAAIVKMIVALADSLGLAVIAEGVENESQKHFLARHGCHAYQGFLFSKPLSLENFEAFALSSECENLSSRSASDVLSVA